jgi:hypothetical protein
MNIATVGQTERSSHAPALFLQGSLISTSSNMQGKQKGRSIENPKHFAASFACAVTVPSSSHTDWVARNGEESLFEALQIISPEVCMRFTNSIPQREFLSCLLDLCPERIMLA